MPAYQLLDPIPDYQLLELSGNLIEHAKGQWLLSRSLMTLPLLDIKVPHDLALLTIKVPHDLYPKFSLQVPHDLAASQSQGRCSGTALPSLGC